MADKVLRLKNIGLVEQQVTRDTVTLKVTGGSPHSGGKTIRAEIALDAYDLRRVVQQLRAGAKQQAEVWAETVAALGAEA